MKYPRSILKACIKTRRKHGYLEELIHTNFDSRLDKRVAKLILDLKFCEHCTNSDMLYHQVYGKHYIRLCSECHFDILLSLIGE